MSGEHQRGRVDRSDACNEIRPAGYGIAELYVESPFAENVSEKARDGCFAWATLNKRGVSRIDASERACERNRIGARNAGVTGARRRRHCSYLRAFLEPPFFEDLFDGADFFGGGFFAAGFLTGFLGAGFFGAGFFGAGFFGAGFFGAGFFGAAFFGGGFFATGFFAAGDEAFAGGGAWAGLWAAGFEGE
jgi:hypothetical protein